MAEVRDSVRRFFGDNADSWQRRYYRRDFDSINYQDRMGEALRLLEAHAGKGLRVLDLGCGAGVLAAQMQARGHEVYACDIALEMAARARDQIGPRAAVAVGEQLPFVAASFDAVVALGVIGYSKNPQAFLASLQRVLKPGGLLVISSADQQLLLEQVSERISRWPSRWYRWAKERLTGRALPQSDKGKDFYRSVYHYRGAREFDALLAQGGFERLAGSGVNFGRLHFMGKPLMGEAMAIWLTRGLTRLSRQVPELQQYARIYVTALRRPELPAAALDAPEEHEPPQLLRSA